MNMFKSVERIFDIYCQSKDKADFLDLQGNLEPSTLKACIFISANIQTKSNNYEGTGSFMGLDAFVTRSCLFW